MALVRVNEQGRRIGEGHHRAVLSDSDVDQLLADREAGLSLAQLARKWKMSKSGVKGIVDGSRRGQVGPSVDGVPSKRETVEVRITLTLQERALLRRLGGSKWVRKKLMSTVRRKSAGV